MVRRVAGRRRRSQGVERVELSTMFAQLEATIAEQLDGKPVHFVWRVEADVPCLQTDGRKLRQIVSGLLSNAVKCTNRGAIRLHARRVSDHEVEISVEDSGVGIPPSDFDRIFEEFRQIDGSLTRRVDGLGLGLALVRELTTILGGHIRVESGAQRGSTFHVRLPIERGAGATPAADVVHGRVDLAPAPA